MCSRHRWLVGQASVLVLAAAWTALECRASQSDRALIRDGDLWVAWRVDGFYPVWKGGVLVGVEENKSREPLIYSINRDGAREDIRFGLPDAYLIIMGGIAAGADGAIAVIGGAYSSDARAGTFLAWISPDRKTRTVTRVWPYVPRAVTIAADGTIWTIGWIRDGERIPVRNVLRKYDSRGSMLASFVERRAKGWTNTRGDAVSDSTLTALADGVVWLTNGGEYIEYSSDLRERGRFDGPVLGDGRRIEGVAVTASDDIYVGITGGGKWDVMWWNRLDRTWNIVPFPEAKPPHWGRLLGADGNALVTATPEVNNLRRYRIVKRESAND